MQQLDSFQHHHKWWSQSFFPILIGTLCFVSLNGKDASVIEAKINKSSFVVVHFETFFNPVISTLRYNHLRWQAKLKPLTKLHKTSAYKQNWVSLMNLSHIRGEGHMYSLTFPLFPPFAMLLANWFFLFVLTWYPTRLSPLKFSPSWGDIFFLSKFFHVFVVTITSCKNVVTPWAKSAFTGFIRKSTRILRQKTKSCPLP